MLCAADMKINWRGFRSLAFFCFRGFVRASARQVKTIEIFLICFFVFVFKYNFNVIFFGETIVKAASRNQRATNKLRRKSSANIYEHFEPWKSNSSFGNRERAWRASEHVCHDFINFKGQRDLHSAARLNHYRKSEKQKSSLPYQFECSR